MAKKDINFRTYVKRDLNKTTVDWGTVANKLSTDLLKIRKEREEERAELRARNEDDIQTVNTQEDYTNRSLQDLALNMSGESANFLRVQNELFENGQITQTELAQGRQRVLGDWKQFGNVSKRWESDYASMKKRVDDGEGSSFEAWFSKQNAAFGNLNDVQGFVNPATGRLSLIRRNEDGSFPTDPSQFVSMNVINNRFSARVDNVTHNGNLTKALNTKVDSLGELILTTIESNGEVFSIEGQQQALQSEAIQTFLDETAAQFTVNDNSVFSILGDINGKYSPTDNAAEAEADPYKVLIEYDNNGVPVPVKEGTNWSDQVDAAKEIIRDKMILMLDRKESGKPGDVYTKYQRENIKLKKRELDMIENKDQENKDEELEDSTYRPANYSNNAYGVYGGEGKDQVSVYDYIDGFSGNFAFTTNADAKKAIKNIITGTMDPNILNDLADGKYGKDEKALDFQFISDGKDHFIVTLGNKTFRYPPEGYSIREYPYEDKKTIINFLKDNVINPQTQRFIDMQKKNRADTSTDPFGNPI